MSWSHVESKTRDLRLGNGYVEWIVSMKCNYHVVGPGPWFVCPRDLNQVTQLV